MPSNATLFGEPLKAPVTQTILPVVQMQNTTAIVLGFFPIASTEFTGTETEFTLPEGPVRISSVTLPNKINDGTGYFVPQFMAAVYDYRDATDKQYLGYASFVDTNNTGYFSSWSMPIEVWTHRFGRGSLIGSLTVGMDKYVYDPNSNTPPTPPDPVNGTLRWATSIDLNSAAIQCAFFDFNWIDLFKATYTSPDPETQPVNPLKIETISNPPTGEFKASIVQASQSYSPVGGVLFNTIRIIRLHDTVEAGSYVFDFMITDQLGNQHPVTLTLTVV